MRESPYKFYEKVIIKDQNLIKEHIDTTENFGFILGMAYNDETDKWVYSIIFSNESLSFEEDEITGTGIIKKREDFY